MNALWRRQFDIDENETNCVNYKYCLFDAPRSFKFVHRLGESAADQLRGHLEQGISDGPHPTLSAQLIWGDNFDCSGEAMPWHAQTRQYL